MGAQHTFGTAGATGGGFSAQPGSLQPSYEEIRHEPRWSWQQRSPKTLKDKAQWRSRWSFGVRISGPGLDFEYAPAGNCLAFPDPFEPFSCDGNGCQKKNAIRGQCLDASSVAVPSATVQGFVTATDAFVGEVVSGGDGTYVLPTEQLKTTAHYLVAYKAGSPDIAGTSVNTLLPTEIDGT